MEKCKNSFVEWLVYTMIFFFLYDIIWILADLSDFMQSLNENYIELFIDFVLCGIFSPASGFVNRWQLRQKRFRIEGQGHKAFVWNVGNGSCGKFHIVGEQFHREAVPALYTAILRMGFGYCHTISFPVRLTISSMSTSE